MTHTIFAVLDYPGVRKNYYKIDTLGNIYVIRTGKKRKPYVCKNGYLMITLSGSESKYKKVLIHRAVVNSFVGNVSGLEVNHIDGDKTNNSVENLELCDSKYNSQHALEVGLTPVGEDHKLSKYKETEIRAICELLQSGKRPIEIMNLLNNNVHDSTLYSQIMKIKYRIRWKHIVKDYNF